VLPRLLHQFLAVIGSVDAPAIPFYRQNQPKPTFHRRLAVVRRRKISFEQAWSEQTQRTS